MTSSADTFPRDLEPDELVEEPADLCGDSLPARDGGGGTSRRDLWWWLGGSLLLPLALYVAMRPENYSLTPNSLDPVFYTGYSINFDDVLNAVGDRHYFVTRWPAYYPMYVVDAVLGPLWGRLIWRWVLATLVVVAVWSLGSRLRWSRPQQILAATVVLTMPMFVRAFMTDYVEYMVVALGLCLVVLCLRETQTWRTAAMLGVTVGLMLVANPVAIFPATLACLTALVLCRGGVRSRVMLVCVSVIGAIGVVLGGLVLFRWQYGIDNVYEPSIDFMRTYQGDPDSWKSPRLDWLGRFLWIYSPPIVLVTGVSVARLRKLRWTRVEAASLVMSGAMYAFQWYDQFAREGFSLELSFYWSFGYPAFGIATAVVLGKLTTGVQPRVIVGLTLAWVVLLSVGVEPSLRLPAGLRFAVIAIGFVGASVALARRMAWFPVFSVLVMLAWVQIGTPGYDPSPYFALDVSPRYGLVFRQAGSTSEKVLDEAIWFEANMDRVVNDASASFLVAGGWSSSITGLYAPHVTGRVVQTELGTGRLGEQIVREIKAGGRPIIAVYGLPEYVALIVDAIADQLDVGQQVLDETNQEGLGYRLVVYAMPDAANLPFTWTGASLLIASGDIEGESVLVTSPTKPSFVTFGPYIALRPGRYAVTLAYASEGTGDDVVGGFDISWLGGDRLAAAELSGTDGATSTVTIEFEVQDAGRQWEFRTAWSGVGDLRIDSVRLAGVLGV